MTGTQNFMISSNLEPLKKSKIFWFAGLGSLGIYFFVLSYSVSYGRVPNTSSLTYQVTSLVGLLSFLTGIFLPQFLLRKLRRENSEVFLSHDSKEVFSQEMRELVMLPYILRLGFFAATGLTGFILGYITINVENSYPCFILSILGLLYNFPSKRVYRRILSL